MGTKYFKSQIRQRDVTWGAAYLSPEPLWMGWACLLPGLHRV